MARRNPPTHTTLFTPNRSIALLGTLGTVVLAVLGYLAVSYITVYIPTKIETEVARQFHVQVKGQIAEEIKNNISIQMQQVNKELGQKIADQGNAFNERIDGIYAIINQKTFAPAVKGGTRRNHHATLMKTLPVSRELLAFAKAKALSEPKEAPILTQSDFIEITNNLFARYRDPELNEELWYTLLELASYKTVIDGLKFGFAKPSSYDEKISLNDREFSNQVISGKTVFLAECGVVLRNVRFINCEFDVQRGVNGEHLLRTILTSGHRSISLRLDPPPGYVKGACEK